MSIRINSLGPNLWISHNWEYRYASVGHKKVGGVDQKISQYLVWLMQRDTCRASQHTQWVTCLVSMQAMEELGYFQLPGIVYRSLRHEAVHYHAETWGDGGRLMAQQWASGSRHGISVHWNCHRFKCSCVLLSVVYAARTITPPPPWALC